MQIWTEYGTIGLMQKVNKAELCPLGKARFNSEDAFRRVCEGYRKHGYIAGNIRCASEPCRRCNGKPDCVVIDPSMTA